VIEVHAQDMAELDAAANALRGLSADAPVVDVATRRVSLGVDGGTERLTEAARALEAHGVSVDDIALRRPTLDEVFLALTGQGVEAPNSTGRGKRRAA
jgi:ABC-2 type transport system ATP-binding protein